MADDRRTYEANAGAQAAAKRPCWPVRVWRFYVDGFRSMTSTGRMLWVVILVKLFIMFAILKIFFFPDLLKTNYDTDQERAEAVRTALTTPKK